MGTLTSLYDSFLLFLLLNNLTPKPVGNFFMFLGSTAVQGYENRTQDEQHILGDSFSDFLGRLEAGSDPFYVIFKKNCTFFAFILGFVSLIYGFYMGMYGFGLNN